MTIVALGHDYWSVLGHGVAPHTFLFLTGNEPDLQWERFSLAVLGLLSLLWILVDQPFEGSVLLTVAYDSAKKRALELAKHISDDLLRDAAVRQIVNLCMSANDVETAAVLIGAIQTEKIRAEMLNEHPSLR